MSEPVNETAEAEIETNDETPTVETPAPDAPADDAPALDAPADDDASADGTDDVAESVPAEADADEQIVDSAATSEDGEEPGAGRPARRERLEQEGDIAADYLEELLEITDLDGDLDMDVEGDRATVSVVGANLPQLVGEQGEVLEALQELTRLAVYRETGERSRLMLDVSGHRAARRTSLEEQAAQVVAQVRETGEQVSLEPMSPFERKVVHDVVAAAGLKSESEGAEPRRYVVVLPA